MHREKHIVALVQEGVLKGTVSFGPPILAVDPQSLFLPWERAPKGLFLQVPFIIWGLRHPGVASFPVHWSGLPQLHLATMTHSF